MNRSGFSMLIYRRVIVSNLLVRADVTGSQLSVRLFPPVKFLLSGVVPSPLLVVPEQVARVVVSRRLMRTAVIVPTPESELPPFMVSYWVAASFLPDMTMQAERMGRFDSTRLVRGPYWF